LFFLCFRLTAVRVLSKSFSVFFLCYRSFIAVISQFLPQTAIGQTNRRRAERLQLPFHPDRRTFPNLTICYCFRVRQTIGKNDEAGNTRARLDYQLALSVSFDALLNFSRNFNSRIDKLRQVTTRRRYVRTSHSVGNRL
jgi:hypothetical protein